MSDTEPTELENSSTVETVKEEEQSSKNDNDIDSRISAIVSFIIPGAGHFVFNDQSKRGAAIFLLAVVLDISFFILSSIIGIFTFGVGIILYALIPVVHIGAAYDAYNQAEKINMDIID